ncbi:MAG TPA: hypothetical protein VL147_14610 [Devosia sp.]|nr:hypothetical protein [Devosia sp.]
MGFKNEVASRKIKLCLVVIIGRKFAGPIQHFCEFSHFSTFLRASWSVARSGAKTSSVNGSMAQGLRLASSARGQVLIGNRDTAGAQKRASDQAGVAQGSDARPSKDPMRVRNVEEKLAANLVAAIEVVSHDGFSCECRMMAAWSGR